MADKRYNVVFSGKLVEDRPPQEVLAKLSSVLGLEQQEVREIFKGGFGAIVLNDQDSSKAYSMREDLRDAGAICTVQEIIPPKTAESPTGDMRTMEAPRQARPTQRPSQDSRPLRPPPAVVAKSGPGVGALLFKVILVATLAGGGWWGYQTYLAPPSPAFKAYTLFAEALAREEYQKATEASTGQARGHAEARTQMMAPSSMKIYGKELSMSKPTISSIAGDIAWIKHKRKEEKKSDAGNVIILVEETVCRIPPGVSSAICKWPVTFLHNVEVAQAEGTWKVSSFKEERLTPLQ
jgi:hypothetical protein